MKKIKVLVEGQTEIIFTNGILKPYFNEKYLSFKSVLLQEGGGIPKYSKARKEILKALRSDGSCFYTTMIDYYGMPHDWPGKVESQSFNNYKDKAQKIEQELVEDIVSHMGVSWNPAHFIPYVQMHEFEALLFSNISALAGSDSRITGQLEIILKSFSCPEEINDNYDTCPSRRIKHIIESYNKRVDGIVAAQKIGLKQMREKCPHFNEWIGKLEWIGEQ